jgi:hypothetical protein
MPSNLVAASFAALAVVAASAAFYYWRRSSSLYALLVEGANRFEELRQRNTQLEQAMQKVEDRMRQQREAALRLEKGVDDAREKAAELVKRLEAKDHELRVVTEKLELQKAHLEKQLAKADERMRLAEAHRVTAEETLAEQVHAVQTAAEQRVARAQEEARLTAEAARQDVGLRERELTARLRELEKEHAVTQKKVKEADPVEMRKLRRRIAQYDRLYNSMKGLREMTDERNRNYEVALTRLSAWVLRSTGHAQLPQQLGPLVGSALQAIGAQLIEDNDVHPAASTGRVHTIPDRGATRADSMDEGPDGHEAAPSDEALAAEEAALAAEHAAAGRSGSGATAGASDDMPDPVSPIPPRES